MINDQKEKQIDKNTEDEQVRDQGSYNDMSSPTNDRPEIANKELEDKWQSVKGPFQREYSNLTDADLDYKKGEFGQMLGRVGAKTGMSDAQLRKKILSWDDTSSRTL